MLPRHISAALPGPSSRLSMRMGKPIRYGILHPPRDNMHSSLVPHFPPGSARLHPLGERSFHQRRQDSNPGSPSPKFHSLLNRAFNHHRSEGSCIRIAAGGYYAHILAFRQKSKVAFSGTVLLLEPHILPRQARNAARPQSQRMRSPANHPGCQRAARPGMHEATSLSCPRLLQRDQSQWHLSLKSSVHVVSPHLSLNTKSSG